MQLKHTSAVGIYGWGSVCETVAGQWLEDITQNQVSVYRVYIFLPYMDCVGIIDFPKIAHANMQYILIISGS